MIHEGDGNAARLGSFWPEAVSEVAQLCESSNFSIDYGED